MSSSQPTQKRNVSALMPLPQQHQQHQQPDELASLYLFLRNKMAALEPMLCDFYTDLIRQLGLLDRQTLMLDGKEQTLTEDLMQRVVTSPIDTTTKAYQEKKELDGDFVLFTGAYIRLFEDGSVFQKIMYRIFESLGEAKIVWVRWKSTFRHQGKSCPKLRTFYWFIDNNFLAQLPVHPYVSFTADALLYCRWRCDHPNLIGFHLLIFTWMLNVSQFRRFAPPDIRASVPFVDPLLKLFWPVTGLAIAGFTPAPITKAPVFKTPVTKKPPLGKKSRITRTPVTKTSVTKTPVTKTPATKTPVTKTPVTRTPPVTKATTPKSPASKRTR